MTEKTIIYEDVPVFYRVTGEGRTVVLVHGFSEDGEIWVNQVNALKNKFRLIVPDIPGSGRSQLLKNAGIDTYAEVIRQILDVEVKELDKKAGVIMIGHSMGGYITLAFVEKYPQYLSAFGLFHSSAFADDEEKKQARRKSIDFIRQNGAAAFLKTSIPGLFTKDFVEHFPDKINALIESGHSFSADALVQYYEAMIDRPDRTHILKSFNGPVLFIMGEFDNAIPLAISLQQCYLPNEAHVHLFTGSAHMGMWEEPDRANEALEAFLQ